jgi:hypothetical protein
MGEVTLKVPAEVVDPLREAAVVEIGSTAEWVKSVQEELLRRCATGKATEGAVELADVRGSARCMSEDLDIAEQLFDAGIWRDRTLRGDASAFAHILQTLADKILAPRLNSETFISPYGPQTVEKVAALTSALGWAVGEAARLQELDRRELKAEKAAG